jgi:hypothetical protein
LTLPVHGASTLDQPKREVLKGLQLIEHIADKEEDSKKCLQQALTKVSGMRQSSLLVRRTVCLHNSFKTTDFQTLRTKLWDAGIGLHANGHFVFGVARIKQIRWTTINTFTCERPLRCRRPSTHS